MAVGGRVVNQLHHGSITGDPFIQSHIGDLLRTVRTQVSQPGSTNCCDSREEA